jgi:hypothetical protein
MNKCRHGAAEASRLNRVRLPSMTALFFLQNKSIDIKVSRDRKLPSWDGSRRFSAAVI